MAVTISAHDPPLDEPPDLLPAGDGQLWHSSAPKRLRAGYRSSDDPQSWRTWCRHLRRRPKLGVRLSADEQWPLFGDPLRETSDAGPARLAALFFQRPDMDQDEKKGPSELTRQAECWLSDRDMATGAADFACECLAAARALPQLARRLPAMVWWRVLNRLVQTAQQGNRFDLSSEPLASQCLGGELPLTLALQFPELIPCRSLAASARKVLSLGIAELLDGEGLPHAEHLDLVRPLLACWTRSRAIGAQLRKGCWDRAAEKQFKRFVGEAIRLTRPDGSQTLLSEPQGAWSPRLFKLALRIADSATTDQLARRLLPHARHRAHATAIIKRSPAVHSEWAELAVLRPSWRRTAPQLTVSFANRRVDCELTCHDKLLWSGVWESEVTVNGKPAVITSAWESVCWLSDKDVDYLEIEAQFGDQLRIQRQIVLGRKDKFLFLADAILGTQPLELQYVSRLPLTAECGLADETREGWLSHGKSAVAIIPPALPEWRADPRRGSLKVESGKLELRQTAVGRCLYIPLFIDLDARRARAGLTWRQLTVADQRNIEPADSAVGYRVQVGKDHWLIYRALASKGVRTVLGHNLLTEFLCGRFDPENGTVEKLVEIE